MWDFVIVICRLDQINPGYILFGIKLVEVFEKEGVILQVKVDYSQSSFVLWLDQHRPSSQVAAFLSSIISSPNALFPCPINVFN